MARRKKLKMNPPPGTTALVVGTLIVGVTAGGILLYSRQAQAKPKKKGGCPPYKYNEAAVRASVELAVDRGERDAIKIAVDTATELFGTYPGGGTVTFPPGPSARAGVACVWGKVVAMVADIFDERGINPDQGGDEGVDIVIHDPFDDGYPWEEASLETNNYPTPGMFADVGGSKDAFDYSKGTFAVMAAALNSAIAMAAAQGIDVSVAQNTMSQDAAKSAAKRDLEKQMVAATFCGAWNDALWNREVPADEKTSAKNLYGWVPNGRSPLYLPQHNDVLGQMALGERPRRAITLNGSHKSGNNRRNPVFWIPAINLERLGGPKPVVTTAGMKWSDGSSTSEPPPVVQRLGIDLNGVSLPGGPGCK